MMMLMIMNSIMMINMAVVVMMMMVCTVSSCVRLHPNIICNATLDLRPKRPCGQLGGS
jgi:hypothetical protein